MHITTLLAIFSGFMLTAAKTGMYTNLCFKSYLCITNLVCLNVMLKLLSPTLSRHNFFYPKKELDI